MAFSGDFVRVGVFGRYSDDQHVVGRHLDARRLLNVQMSPDNALRVRFTPGSATGVRIQPDKARRVRKWPVNAMASGSRPASPKPFETRPLTLHRRISLKKKWRPHLFRERAKHPNAYRADLRYQLRWVGVSPITMGRCSSIVSVITCSAI